MKHKIYKWFAIVMSLVLCIAVSRCEKDIEIVPITDFGDVPEGATNGRFTIDGNGNQVFFSQGNLQYRASDGKWRFAAHQYDIVGELNSKISSSYSGWIDLFGWGTSGYNHGAVCYQPWNTSDGYSNYYAYGQNDYNLFDQTGQADWGYNAISNGGNQTGQWRTLTHEEWQYVFSGRNNAANKYGSATVNGIHGVVLLPDNWSLPTGCSFTSGMSGWSNNDYTATQWQAMEAAGAVFLPAAGYRNGTAVGIVGSYGYYWSASYYGAIYAGDVRFYVTNLNPENGNDRCYGRSVRLVRSSQ